MSKINSFMSMVNNSLEDKPVDNPFSQNKNTKKKLTFRRGRAKNFRSVGNEFIEIDYEKNQATLITSEDNGNGKSTLTIWLPYFVLLDKPYSKKATKPSLVNSINGKDCVAELEFFINGKEYLVRRGIKPAIFDICELKEGQWVRIEDEAATKDYQGYLLNILGLEKKSAEKILENMILLGLDKFQPFIEMSAGDRRVIVEAFWDMGIFSLMSDDIGKQQSRAKAEESTLFHAETNTAQKLEHARQRLNDLSEAYDQQMEQSNNQKIGYENEINTCNEKIQQLTPLIEELEKDIKDIDNNQIAPLVARRKAIDEKIAQIESELSHLDVDSDPEVVSYQSQVDTLQANVDALNDELSNIEKVASKFKEKMQEPVEDNDEITSLRQELVNKTTILEQLQQRILDINTSKSEETEKFSKSRKEFEVGNNTKSTLYTNLHTKQAQKAEYEKAVADYEHMTKCPTCSQVVTEEAKQNVRDNAQPGIDKCNEEIAKIEDNIRRCNELLGEVEKRKEEAECNLASLEKELSSKNQQISDILDDKRNIETNIKNIQQQLTSERNAKILSEVNKKTDVIHQKIRDEKSKLSTAQNDLRNAKTNVVALAKSSKMVRVNEDNQQVMDELNKVNQHKAEISIKYNNLVSDYGHYYSLLAPTTEKLKMLNDTIKKYTDAYVIKSGDRMCEIENLTQQLDADKRAIEDNGKLQEDLKVARNLISDKEIKADIIKQYLPFLNAKINEYLEALNLFIGFEIDEHFEVTMNANERKNQTLFSLSSGQRARINLAINLALIEVGSLKSSIQCNLFTCDEIFESLSAQGVEEAILMMKTKFPDTNLFVVTQRNEEFAEYFENRIHVALRDGFTKIV